MPTQARFGPNSLTCSGFLRPSKSKPGLRGTRPVRGSDAAQPLNLKWGCSDLPDSVIPNQCYDEHLQDVDEDVRAIRIPR